MLIGLSALLRLSMYKSFGVFSSTKIIFRTYFQIVDLFEEGGQALGTRVELYVENRKTVKP